MLIVHIFNACGFHQQLTGCMLVDMMSLLTQFVILIFS